MSATNHDTEARTETETEEESNSGSQPKPKSEPEADETLEELPPSAKLVYKVLEYEGPMTQEQIATQSRLCPRTVRYALGKLDDDDLVSSRVHLEDARQSVYRIDD